jgi:hypothetical protein
MSLTGPRAARADFGFVEPSPTPRERRTIRNIYAQLERESTHRANAAERSTFQRGALA